MNQSDSEISSSEPEMSLLQYFSRVSKPDGVSLPSPLGSLSLSIPTAAIASANAEVRLGQIEEKGLTVLTLLSREPS